jgi:hypothetical protein
VWIDIVDISRDTHYVDGCIEFTTAREEDL